MTSSTSVQDPPVPLDRRMWLESQVPLASGCEVTVIWPKRTGDPRRQLVNGVHVYFEELSGRGLHEYQVELLGDSDCRSGVDDCGHAFVDLIDADEVESFILERSEP
jgi:hypothetical protein